MNTLIAYASRHGSTAEVAEFIGTVMTEQRIRVTIQPVGQVMSLDPYDAVLLGSPIHSGMWLPEMALFVQRWQQQLERRLTYLWVTSIRVLEADGVDYVMDNYLPRALMRQMNVRSVAAFAGKLDLARVNWSERWTLAARFAGEPPCGDFRDWDLIRDWAEAIVADMRVVLD